MKNIYKFLITILIFFFLQFCKTYTNITTNVRLPQGNYKFDKNDNLEEGNKLANSEILDKKNCDCPLTKKEPKNADENLNEDSKTNIVEPEDTANKDFSEVGLASWYGKDFDGKLTASGVPFDSNKISSAHKTIPLGSKILVQNMENKKQIEVIVNDRGPYIKGRILDLSEKGAELLGYKQEGLTHVGIKVIEFPSKKEKVSHEGKGATYEYFQEAKLEQEKEVKLGGLTTGESILDEGQGYYSVQVGTFYDLRLAKKLEERLEPFKEPVKIIKRAKLFVVRIGNFKNSNEATKLKNKLNKEGHAAFIMSPY